MKICHVVPWFPSVNPTTLEARQGIFEYRQIMKLSERGHEFKVISVKWKGQSEYEKISDSIDVYRIPYIFNFSKIRYPIPNFIKLANKIKEIRNNWHPDIMVYSHPEYLTALPIFCLRGTARIPLIVIIDTVPGITWFCDNKVIEAIGYFYYRLVERRIFKVADAIHFIHAELYRYVSRLGIDANKVFVQTRGVDVELFKPIDAKINLREKLGIESSDTIVLYVGRLEEVKGVNYLLHAAKELIPQHTNLKFLIVGDGSLRKSYEILAKPFRNDIIFTGYREDIPALMNISDIFVIPQLAEGLGNVVMEALASGLPVIASGIDEVPGVLAINPRDVDGLIRATGKLIDNPSWAQKMGQAGRRRMEKKYSWEVIAKETESIYEKVIHSFHSKNAGGRL